MKSQSGGFKDVMSSKDLKALSNAELARIAIPEGSNWWTRHCVSYIGGNETTFGFNTHFLIAALFFVALAACSLPLAFIHVHPSLAYFCLLAIILLVSYHYYLCVRLFLKVAGYRYDLRTRTAYRILPPEASRSNN